MPQLKIMSTSKGHIRKYEDLKRKIYNGNANIYFNKKFYVKIQSKILPS